jgi:hypothetical protein
MELGVENKVTLMMFVLSQDRLKDDNFHPRIPNLQQMKDLNDIVVLQDLLSWGGRFKETDYLTNNIRNALLDGL